MTIENFVISNIFAINAKITDFKKDKDGNGPQFIDVQIKDYLQDKFSESIKDKDFVQMLLTELKNNNYTKTKIEQIANSKILYKPHLQKFYETEIYRKVFTNLDLDELAKFILLKIKESESVDEQELKFISSELQKLIRKCLYVASQKGFTGDIQNTNYGVRVSNEGDSAQFLFIARAMLAGFNCSNVDVRTSSYDSIVDVDSKLIRVQVKGITESNTISFFTRARGGQGIDYKHERNKPKRIGSKDCDIYVAVDKQVGTCYIIPMSFAETILDEDADMVKLKDVENYLENWGVISQVAKTL